MNKHPVAGFAAICLVAFGISAATLPSDAMAKAKHPTLSNVVPQSASAMVYARITALNPTSRAVTLQGRSGQEVSVVAGPDVRLDMLKVGDTVSAQYYRSVGFMVVPASGGNGTPEAPDNAVTQMMARPVKAPGGVAVQVTKVSGTVVGIDMASHSVDLVNPTGGGIYTFAVTDPKHIALLPHLKIGDTITAVVSEALAVKIEPAPKSWF